MWQHWVNATLGLWIILSPFLGMSTSEMILNFIIVGTIIALLSFAEAHRTGNYGGHKQMYI